MSIDEDILNPEPAALIVFTRDNGHWLARLLHPARRHCFAVVPSQWAPSHTSIEIDLKLGGILIGAARGCPEQLADWYASQGLEVVRVPYRPEKRQLLPMILNNCVGLTKQVTGFRSWALTPHQLWRVLRRTSSCHFVST
jgi:hypothetical protein